MFFSKRKRDIRSSHCAKHTLICKVEGQAMVELKLKIVCMSLAELMGDERVDLEKWEQMAEEIWGPLGETMRRGERMLQYGKYLGKDYAQVCFCMVGKELVGYTWGYPVNEQELQVISNGATELTRYSEGVQTLWWIDTTGVLKSFRKQGVARALARKLIEKVRGFGFTYMISRTEFDSVRRMRKELGFKRTGISDRKDEEADFYVLAL